jgi:hypothetical protein
VRWDYRMVFSDDFCIIEGGEIISFDISNSKTLIQRYPHDLCYWRDSLPPTDLLGCVFTQGGQVGLASYHFPIDMGIDGAYISYEDAPPTWLLDNGDPPPPRKFFIDPTFDPPTRTFRGIIEWQTSPFSGEVKWEYTMVFSECFSHIVGGGVRGFSDVVQPPSSDSVYGLDLNYDLFVEAEVQMMHCLRQLRVNFV